MATHILLLARCLDVPEVDPNCLTVWQLSAAKLIFHESYPRWLYVYTGGKIERIGGKHTDHETLLTPWKEMFLDIARSWLTMDERESIELTITFMLRTRMVVVFVTDRGNRAFSLDYHLMFSEIGGYETVVFRLPKAMVSSGSETKPDPVQVNAFDERIGIYGG